MSEYIQHDYKLKSCPFCGGMPDIIKAKIHYPNADWFFYPSCENGECIAHVEEQDEQGGVNCEFQNIEDAVKAWNTRKHRKRTKS